MANISLIEQVNLLNCLIQTESAVNPGSIYTRKITNEKLKVVIRENKLN